jgi:gas vesicle protein
MAEAASSTSRPVQGVMSKDVPAAAPASRKQQITSCDQILKLDNIMDGSLPLREITSQLRQEIDRLKEMLSQLKSRSDRGIQQLQAEIEEEKLARQALQDEVTQLKSIVSARLSHV